MPQQSGDAGKRPNKPKTDEKDLLRRVQDYSQPTTLPELTTGLLHARELGEFYIKERRPDDAAKFFAGLAKPDQKIPAYRLLGKLGHAIALAYKDEAKASNGEFLIAVAEIEKLAGAKTGKKEPGIQDEAEGYRQVWKQNPPLRELTAKALDRNFANDRENFPADKLESYRHAPRPTLKPAPIP